MHDELQGIVRPNINILSSFIHPHVLFEFLSSSSFLHTMEVNGYRQLYHLQNILFCVQQKTEAQVGVG